MTTSSEICPHCKKSKLVFIPGEWGRLSVSMESAMQLPGHYSCKNCGYYRENEIVVAMQYTEKKVSGVVSSVVRNRGLYESA